MSVCTYKEDMVTEKESEIEVELNLVCACGCKEIEFRKCISTEGMGYFCVQCGEYRYSGCL
jgi:hypothetical protein